MSKSNNILQNIPKHNHIEPAIDIDKLISDLRMFSWEASDILMRYSQMLRDPNNKIKIIEDKNNNKKTVQI